MYFTRIRFFLLVTLVGASVFADQSPEALRGFRADRTSGQIRGEEPEHNEVDILLIENALRAAKLEKTQTDQDELIAKSRLQYQRELYQMAKSVYEKHASSDEELERALMLLQMSEARAAETRAKATVNNEEVEIWELKLKEKKDDQPYPVKMAECFVDLWTARSEAAKAETQGARAQSDFWKRAWERRKKLALGTAISQEELLRVTSKRDDAVILLAVSEKKETDILSFVDKAKKDLEDISNKNPQRK